MTESATTTVRFPTWFVERLGLNAKQLGLSKNRLLQQSAILALNLLVDAKAETLEDLRAIADGYGRDAVLLLWAERDEEGKPQGRILINGTVPREDLPVRCIALVDADEPDGVWLFLDVARERTSRQVVIEFGQTALFARDGKNPAGKLPWPPQPTDAIKIELSRIDEIFEDGIALKRLAELA
jgi:hypothetical protein